MKVDIESSTIAGEIEIDASPEAVFMALTDADQPVAWWGDDSMYRTINWKLDLRVGGAWSSEAKNADGALGSVHGRFLEIDPPRTLAYTWNPSWDATGETNVRYTLTPTASGTRVNILHDGFGSNVDSLTSHLEGWSRVLAWLGRFLGGTSISGT